jgi:RimJ/RimL family protein N-acetyltransferase
MASSPFQGNRITLRPFEPEDAAALGTYLNDPELVGQRELPWGFPDLAPLTRQQIQGILQRWAEQEKGLPLAVVRREDGKLLGHGEAGWQWDVHSPSVAVVIAPEHQRQGYGSEALKLLMRYLFDTTIAHSVGSWIADWNAPALAFVQHHGFHVSGRMRRAGIRESRYFDLVIHDILRPEWKAAYPAE